MDEQQEKVKHKNILIPCIDCPDKKEFVFEGGEQAFYTKNKLHFPIRCQYHRKLKAQRRRELAQKGTYD